MTTLQRIVTSLLSVLLTLAIASLCLGSADPPHNFGQWIGKIVTIFFYSLFYSSTGWLLALPLVVMVRRTDGWRFWAVLAVGTVIGPMTILAFAVYQGLKSNSPLRMILFANDPMPNPLMLLAAGISFLTTLFFLLFLRHAQQIRKSERVGFMRGQLEVPDDFDRMHEGEIERLFDGRSDS